MKILRKKWFIWLMLFLLPPVGIFLLWDFGGYSMKTKKYIGLFTLVYFFIILKGEIPLLKNKDEEATAISLKENVGKSKEEIIGEAKKKMYEQLIAYEKDHFEEWKKFSESLDARDPYEIYMTADVALEKVKPIWLDSRLLEWGNTGIDEFDEKAKELKKVTTQAYFQKKKTLESARRAADKESPRKVNILKKNMEKAIEDWKIFKEQVNEVYSEDTSSV